MLRKAGRPGSRWPYGVAAALLVGGAGLVAARAWFAAAGKPSAELVQAVLVRQGITVPRPFVLHERYLRARLSPDPGSDLVVVFGDGTWFDTLAILHDGELRFRQALDQLGPGSGVRALAARRLLSTPYPQVVLVYDAGESGTRYPSSLSYLYVFTYLPDAGFRQVFKHVVRDERRRDDGAIVTEYVYRFENGPQGESAIVLTDKQTGEEFTYRWDGCEYAQSPAAGEPRLPAACLPLRHIASFSSYLGRFEVRGRAIYLYSDVLDEVSADPAWFQDRHPSWNGEPVRIARWEWDEGSASFVYVGEAFAVDFAPGLPDLWELADRDDRLALDTADAPWAHLVPPSMRVKAVAEADLDGDGHGEVAVLWTDPEKEGVLSSFFPGLVPKTLAVFKPTNSGFVTAARVDGVGEDYIFSQMTVQDVTGDGLAEVLLWGYSPGGSGGSAVLEVFAKDRGQRYVEGD